jgi:hypothetical protein
VRRVSASDAPDLEEVDLALKARQLGLDLHEPGFEGAVPPSEPLGDEFVGDIQAVDLVHLGLDLLAFAYESLKQRPLAKNEIEVGGAGRLLTER